LSIVQIRQDFSKNLINVLQTGSSNLTLADTNEKAANSQALSTRQSIAVSPLALPHQSQQSLLQPLPRSQPSRTTLRKRPGKPGRFCFDASLVKSGATLCSMVIFWCPGTEPIYQKLMVNV